MPAAAIAISAGVSAISSAYGAHKQAAAAKEAQAAQTDANDKALAFQGQRYADYQNRVQPWVTAGQNASQQMARYLGLPDVYRPPAGAPVAQPPAVTQTQNPAYRIPSQPGSPNDGMVQMRGPDGSIKAVPAVQVPFYLSKGAERIQ